MKRILVAILAIFYICTSTGATIHMHYCMGKLANSSLIHNDDKACSKCGMLKEGDEKNNGCCKDEHKFIKNEKDQKNATSLVLQFNLPVQECFNTTIRLVRVSTQAIKVEYPFSNAPPRTCKKAIYIQKRTFQI